MLLSQEWDELVFLCFLSDVIVGFVYDTSINNLGKKDIK